MCRHVRGELWVGGVWVWDGECGRCGVGWCGRVESWIGVGARVGDAVHVETLSAAVEGELAWVGWFVLHRCKGLDFGACASALR